MSWKYPHNNSEDYPAIVLHAQALHCGHPPLAHKAVEYMSFMAVNKYWQFGGRRSCSRQPPRPIQRAPDTAWSSLCIQPHCDRNSAAPPPPSSPGLGPRSLPIPPSPPPCLRSWVAEGGSMRGACGGGGFGGVGGGDAGGGGSQPHTTAVSEARRGVRGERKGGGLWSPPWQRSTPLCRPVATVQQWP